LKHYKLPFGQKKKKAQDRRARRAPHLSRLDKKSKTTTTENEPFFFCMQQRHGRGASCENHENNNNLLVRNGCVPELWRVGNGRHDV
jgi:hypothetical protein